jgi:hypothetical protein
VWKQAAQREKEEELVFRGLQYVHAIGMFQRKYANAYPPNIDVLVEQRFLRKKYKDPITNDDFAPIPVGQGLPGSGQRGGTPNSGASSAAGGRSSSAPGGTSSTSPATGMSSSTPPGRGTTGPATGLGSPPGGTGVQTTAGISGVTSKSKDASIRLYNGRSHYNEWAFVYTAQMQAAGQGGVPGSAVPGQRGGQPGGPGTQGQPGQRGGPNDPFGRGRSNNPNPLGPGTSPFGTPPGGGRGGFGQPAQPIFGPQPPTTPRGRQ